MSYRKLSIINGNNVTWPLADPSIKTFATNLEGFGFSNTNSLLRLGNMNYVLYSLNNLDPIGFDLMFYADTVEQIYRDYNDFVAFLSVGNLYLIYEVPNVNVFRRPFIVQGLTKTEIEEETSSLICNMAIMPIGFWEDNNENTATITSGYADITVGGNMETPLNYTITGSAMSNPVLKVSRGTSTTAYNYAKFTGTYSSIEVISEELSESIVLKDGSGNTVSNPYNYQDLASAQSMNDVEHVTFFKVSTGSNRVIAGSSMTVTVRWRSRYASV